MSFGCEYSVGQSLLRLIDGMEFPCQILSVQPGNCYRVKYLDDLNVEDKVPASDLSHPPAGYIFPEAPEERIIRVAPVGDEMPIDIIGSKGEAVDDPGVNVIVHGEDDTEMKEEVKEDINVDEIKAVRGGGIRGLRAMRKEKEEGKEEGKE
ncbi:hypothetical protein TrLO_g5941 [Triparma laevis f. longispina]|uniref:Uncharacterized protein n=1 Tax=Triparma laevis f. longispina TaxID=1714387 RepID=A0A9W7ED69_9STRA|nr:hypothetical protein TrLO_g5941 [Triparma laevis f. longispina]